MVIWLSQCLNRTGVLDKKPLLDITRDDILVLDKAITSCEGVLWTPGSVNVFKGKIWPAFHPGSEDPIPQFLQSFTWVEIAFLGLGTILLLGGWRLEVAIWGNRKRAQRSSNTAPEPSRSNDTKGGNFKGNGYNKQKELIPISCTQTLKTSAKHHKQRCDDWVCRCTKWQFLRTAHQCYSTWLVCGF